MLTPDAHGDLIGSPADLAHPLSTTRLNALVTATGLEPVALWGHGDLGSLGWPSPPSAAWRVRLGPNRAELASGPMRLRILAPPRGDVVLIDNLGSVPVPLRLRAVRRVPPGLTGAPRLRTFPGGAVLDAPHGSLALVAAPPPNGAGPSGGLLLAGGARAVLAAAARPTTATDQARRALGAWQARADEVLDHGRWLAGRLLGADPLLTSLMTHALHAALSSEKRGDDEGFAGLAAGHGYAVPARTYFRDGYWTAQALLPFAPALVREQALLLGRAVHTDGEAPSGVIHTSEVGERAWRAMLAADGDLRRDHPVPEEWWSDHFDSPWLYLLLVWDYLAWTGDAALLEVEAAGGRSVRDLVLAVLARTARMIEHAPLPQKPHHDRDWADNVFRSGSVAYDLALAYGAVRASLPALERWDRRLHAVLAEWVRRAPEATLRELWLPSGHLAEYRRPDGSREEHLALDTVVAVRLGLLRGSEAEAHLGALCRGLLTRHNAAQPYGDWGVMCAYPPYARRSELRGKTCFPYRYHNGSDWPYLDGLLAEELLLRRHPDADYVLARAWQVGLEQGWSAPVEYFAPPYGRGSPLQAWSATPARAIVSGAFGIAPGRTPTAPPWPGVTLHGVRLPAAPGKDPHA